MGGVLFILSKIHYIFLIITIFSSLFTVLLSFERLARLLSLGCLSITRSRLFTPSCQRLAFFYT